MILAHLAQIAHPASLALYFQEAPAVGFSPLQLWGNMGNLARVVVIILFIMSIWSLAVIIDRALYFSAARKQSREFAPKVAGASEGWPLWMRQSRLPIAARSLTSPKL